MSFYPRPDDRYSISNQPAPAKKETVDSSLLVMGLEFYDCPELKARFYGATEADAKAKADKALKDAVKSGRLVKVSPFKPVSKRGQKPRDPNNPWALKVPPVNPPGIGDTKNDWKVIGEWYRDDKGEARILCECKCGEKTAHMIRKFQGPTCSQSCSKCQHVRLRQESLERSRASQPPIGSYIGDWKITGLYEYHKTDKMRLSVECKCGRTREMPKRYVLSGESRKCRSCYALEGKS